MENKTQLHHIFWDRKVKIYLIVNFCLFILNITSDTSSLWFVYPLFIWGGVLFLKKFLRYSLSEVKEFTR
ncbi:MAG: 2TM domain-containing protein [Arcobacter sp.]|nr:2TM domain-containing protein [Arcobacter sp.]